MNRIESIDQLRELLGKPHSLTQQKISTKLTAEAQAFIEKCPLMFLATSGSNGVTVSPKGDGPGFVQVVDKQHLLIPERPGNKLLHGLSNILQSGDVGLIFVIPGTEETLRINGHAQLFQDETICQDMSANGKAALLLIKVEVKECFFHCAKAFKRSKAWQADSWQAPVKVNFGAQIANNTGRNKISRAAIAMAVDAAVKADYKHNL